MVLSDLTDRVRTALGRNSLAVRAGRAVYSRCFWWIAAERGIKWRVNGEIIRIDPRVRHLIPHVNEPVLFDFLRSHIRSGDIILDIGSFIGIYAVLEARWAGPSGRVVAFEPTPASGALLRTHLRMNRVEERVTIIDAAVGHQSGHAWLDEFSEPYRNQLARPTTNPLSAAPNRRPVRMVTVDEICGTVGLMPDWIRMDVQGAEFDVLRGALQTVRAGRGRLRVVAEMHPQLWAQWGVDPGSAGALLTSMGLAAVGIETPHDPFGRDQHALITAG